MAYQTTARRSMPARNISEQTFSTAALVRWIVLLRGAREPRTASRGMIGHGYARHSRMLSCRSLPCDLSGEGSLAHQSFVQRDRCSCCETPILNSGSGIRAPNRLNALDGNGKPSYRFRVIALRGRDFAQSPRRSHFQIPYACPPREIESVKKMMARLADFAGAKDMFPNPTRRFAFIPHAVQ